MHQIICWLDYYQCEYSVNCLHCRCSYFCKHSVNCLYCRCLYFCLYFCGCYCTWFSSPLGKNNKINYYWFVISIIIIHIVMAVEVNLKDLLFWRHRPWQKVNKTVSLVTVSLNVCYIKAISHGTCFQLQTPEGGDRRRDNYQTICAIFKLKEIFPSVTLSSDSRFSENNGR